MHINASIKIAATRTKSPKCRGWRQSLGVFADGVPSRSSKSYFQTRLMAGFFMPRDGRYVAGAMDGGSDEFRYWGEVPQKEGVSGVGIWDLLAGPWDQRTA